MAEYCLRWNNHQPNLVTVFSELLTAESLVDVTLATDGHFIHAHKLVLSACSVYFKDLFGSNPCKHPIVFLKDIRIEDLKTVIDFIYRGEVNVSQERLQDVLKTAESLRIKGLADKPFSYDEYPSQTRGQHLSSSFSSQRSSLTDSREQLPSVDAEDNTEGCGNSPPANKKRKITSPQDSSESVQDSNQENDEKQRNSNGKDETTRKSSSSSVNDVDTNSKIPSVTINEKIKQENDSSNAVDPQTEYPESRAADAMLLLQGNSSEGGGGGGGGDEGGTASSSGGGPNNNNARGDSNSSLISSHSQGYAASSSHYARKSFCEPQFSSQFSKETTPYFFPNCIVRAKLKASDGSCVTIRSGTAENFLKAVQEIREGNMGFCKAGKIYGVNHATLQKYYKAMGYSVRNRTNNPKYLRTYSSESGKALTSEGNSDNPNNSGNGPVFHTLQPAPSQRFMSSFIQESQLALQPSYLHTEEVDITKEEHDFQQSLHPIFLEDNSTC